MSDIGNEEYRNNLSQKITSQENPQQRKEILITAKTTQDYWQARKDKLKLNEKETLSEDKMEVLIENKVLYRGSATKGVKEFSVAYEDTIGTGVYFTSEPKNAIGYARRRAHYIKGSSPIIYEGIVDNARLVNLQTDENVKKILSGFKNTLQQELLKTNLPWYYEENLDRVIQLINESKVGANNLKTATTNLTELFTKYLQSLGYDGLIAIEGGEGDEVGNHDTYLIFNPNKVRVTQESKVT